MRVGTASWTDPTMTAAGVFYPTDAGTAEERLQSTPRASRSSRSTPPTTRCRRGGCPSCGSSGPRPTSCSTSRPTRCSPASRRRPSASPRRSARPSRRRSPRRRACTRRTCPASSSPRSGAPSRTASPRSRSTASWAPSSSSTQVVLHLVREPRRDPRGEGGAGAVRAQGRGGVPQRDVVQREERRADPPVPRGRGHPARHGRRAAGLQVVDPARRRDHVQGPRGRPVPRPADRDLGGHEGTRDRRAVPLPVRRGRARGSGSRGSRRSRPRRRTRTS